MSDNPPPSNSESTSDAGNGPHAKKAKTLEQNPTDVVQRPDTSRDGSRKLKLTLHIADVDSFLQDETTVESKKKNLAGINWSITAEMVDSCMALNLNASHPSASQWHCKVSFVFREQDSGRSNSKKVVTVFTEKSPKWGYSRWLEEDDLTYDDEWTVFCEVTTFNCYVTDGAFGCQSRFHDITFDFGDRRLYGNKGFLAANAEYFEVMFFGDFADKSKDVVTLKKVKADDFAEFLIALAPGQMPIQEKNVMRLLRMADRFQAHELGDRCTSALLRETKGIPFSKKLQIADDLLMDDFRDTLVETATFVDIKQAAKLKNESKFSKTTWVKLLLRQIGIYGG
ncbi:BTB/POZ domain-containing protein [Aphelenchoides avenae]|nr:BTB/POZ domain-containing protein [Aphelenchus avenae]